MDRKFFSCVCRYHGYIYLGIIRYVNEITCACSASTSVIKSCRLNIFFPLDIYEC